MVTEKDKIRFLSKVQKTKNGCWLYQGGLDVEGYGVFWMNKRNYKAHRTSFMIYKGEICQGKVICHKCDNPQCVNPKHLFMGTQVDNILDKVRKNRQAKGKTHKCYLYPELTLRGDKNPTSKISDNQVKQMRKLYKTGKYTYQMLADLFHMGRSQTWNIINNKQRKL